jgi:hypothetical protein
MSKINKIIQAIKDWWNEDDEFEKREAWKDYLLPKNEDEDDRDR